MSAYLSTPILSIDLTAGAARGLLDAGAGRMIAWTPSLAARSWVKRGIDLATATLGLLALVPVLLLIAVAVKLSSRGPVLFRQRRMGLGGEVFSCLKFRTMDVDAEAKLAELEGRNEAAGGVLFKIRRDPRITPLGRFLRRSSLDELPQLWNVLRGEMSLVGPRPLQLRDSERLARMNYDAYMCRLSVAPGITGPWQVGGRSDVDGGGMLRLDLDYVADWSLARDLSILRRTVRVVLTGRGAC